MARTRFVEIDGKLIPWRDILKLRREQRKAVKAEQPPLFELRDDRRPTSERSAADRYREPSLFNLLDREG